MADPFREVDEDLRRERLIALWRQYGMLLIGSIAVVVLAVAGYQVYQTRQEAAFRQASLAYDALLERAQAADGPARADILAQVSDLTPGYEILVDLQRAAFLSEAENVTAAVELYDKVADESGDRIVRAYAQIAAARLLVGQESAELLVARLQPLTDPGAPFHAAALELLATVLLDVGDTDGAKSYLDDLINNPQTPFSIRGRAELLRLAIAADKSASGEEKAENFLPAISSPQENAGGDQP